MKLDIYKYLFEIFHKLRIAVGEVNVVVGEGGGERDRYFRRKIWIWDFSKTVHRMISILFALHHWDINPSENVGFAHGIFFQSEFCFRHGVALYVMTVLMRKYEICY